MVLDNNVTRLGNGAEFCTISKFKDCVGEETNDKS